MRAGRLDWSALPLCGLSWREGHLSGGRARADEALRNAGYDFVFANHAVQQITLLQNDVRHLWNFPVGAEGQYCTRA